MSENLWSLHYDLRYGKYKVSGYHSFMIHDPKEREIQAIRYRDRIVQHSLCDNYLIPLLERHLIYDNAACRKGKGTSFAIRRWREFMRRYAYGRGTDGYFVKIDVSKYFPSIDHAILKKKLEKIVDDAKILSLLYTIIDSYNAECGRGLPMGNQSSQCFALLYLDEVDRLVKERLGVRYYIRYMDDMLCIVENRQRAREVLSRVARQMERDGLILNQKSAYYPIRAGVSFLGWRFFYGENNRIVQVVTKASRKRILRRARKMVRGSRDAAQSYVSYRGYLMRGDAHALLRRVGAFLSSPD